MMKQWNWETGKLVKTFSKPKSDFNFGTVFTFNSKLLFTEHRGVLQKWDIETGKIEKSLGGYTETIEKLLVSKDEKSLEIDGRKKWYFETSELTLVNKKFKKPRFSRRLYFHPYKKRVLSVNYNTIEYWDTEKNKLIKTFNIEKRFPKSEIRQGGIYAIFFVPNSESFLTIESYSDDKNNLIKHWNLETGELTQTFVGHKDYISNLIILPNAESFLTKSSDHTIKHWSLKTGKLIQNITAFSGYYDDILLLPDSKSFLSKNGSSEVRHWNLETGKLIQTFPFPNNIRLNTIYHIKLLPDSKSFLTTHKSGHIIHWSLDNDKPMQEFKHNPVITNILLLPNAKSFLTTSRNKTIIHWDLGTGKRLGTFTSKYGFTKSIHLFDNSTKFVTVNTENSITFWDLRKYQEICTLIPKAGNNKDFILVTPDGYYFATKDGVNNLIHYVVGDKIYLFDQFDIRYNRPDIVLERIGLAPKKLIETYRKAYIRRLKKAGFSEERIQFFLNGEFEKDFNAPEIFRKGKGYYYEQKSPQFDIDFRAEDKRYNLDRLNITVNGVPIYGRRGIDILDKKTKIIEQKLSIPLTKGENVIEISALNVQGVESIKDRFEVEYTPDKITKPNLHLITIGVSIYQNSKMNLNYPKKDVEDLIQVFESQKDNYNKITTYQLTNKEATTENILKIKKELLKTNIEDKVIIFYAGHGVLDKDLDYYLATYDMNFANPKDKGLLYDDLENLLDGIPARQKILFMDACHSGEIDKDEVKLVTAKNTEKGKVKFREAGEYSTESKTTGLNNSFELMRETFTDLRKGTGSTVIASAGGVEVAWESEDYQNGIFTYCLLTGLKDKKADLNKDGKVMLSELQSYLQKTVPELTEGTQKPTSRIENLENDFRIW